MMDVTFYHVNSHIMVALILTFQAKDNPHKDETDPASWLLSCH